MGIFSIKESVNLDAYCRDYYETKIMKLMLNEIDVSIAYPQVIWKQIVQVDQNFSKITLEQIANELIPLRFELFSTAWMHRFVNKYSIAQSLLTKMYLHEKKRDDIWNDMEDYTVYIDGGTLHWLTSISKSSFLFNYNMRKGLEEENKKTARKMGLEDVDDDVLRRVNFRVFSEEAWKKYFMLGGLSDQFCKRLGYEQKLNDKAGIILETVIKGLYDGALQDLEQVKIKK